MRRKVVQRICQQCGTEFSTEERNVQAGYGMYCTRKCQYKAQVKIRVPNVKCAYCSKDFFLVQSKIDASKSGLHFCCREHKDKSQSVGGIIAPSHYGTTKKDYRSIAFRAHPQECKRCGYKKETGILMVHHIDLDRANNVPENLEILCPNCHEEEHFSTKTGRWCWHH